MDEQPQPITPAEFDQMSPEERARTFRERIVTDLDALPDAFRERVLATGARISQQRGYSDE
jgi:hypothetical protein